MAAQAVRHALAVAARKLLDVAGVALRPDAIALLAMAALDDEPLVLLERLSLRWRQMREQQLARFGIGCLALFFRATHQLLLLGHLTLDLRVLLLLAPRAILRK